LVAADQRRVSSSGGGRNQAVVSRATADAEFDQSRDETAIGIGIQSEMWLGETSIQEIPHQAWSGSVGGR
jgi:hypothetical protein